MIEGNSIWGSS